MIDVNHASFVETSRCQLVTSARNGGPERACRPPGRCAGDMTRLANTGLWNMKKKIRVCSKSALAEGEMLAVDCAELPPLAAFNVGGRIFVTSNLCTHNLATLTDGFFEGETIECPLHGGCFNVKTGKATQFPCEQPLQTYSAVVDRNEVYIEIDTASGESGAESATQGEPQLSS